MANEVRIGLTVSSNGTTEAETKKAKQLKAAYDDAARSAASMGGTAGSRAAASMATRGVAGGSGSSAQEYGQLRGTAGVTGASARDFANQAQGLGGLVRVYATFAANLFAVSAAFNALREAAQTQQLIRGLDQLGAQSGRALGALSKELVNATGGAISLRESMTAVAQASSAGLANEQIKQLAVVANQASQALGLNMADALNRLSRGISKIEPELLDELGIFVRVDTAVQNYALSIGKTATSLSEFERRQAFANAVLEQGTKKFGGIAAEANPYDKLLASVKDLGLQGLSLINKVLEPIIKLLAESPTALTAVFAGIGGLLLKQAIPALGQFRAGLRATAADALATSESFKNSFGDEFQMILEKRFGLPSLQQNVEKAKQALKQALPPKSLSTKTMESAIQLTSVSSSETQQATALTNLNRALTNRNKIIETGMRGSKAASDAQIQAAKDEAAYLQKVINLYQEKLRLRQAEEKLQGVADIKPGRLDPQLIQLQQYQKLKTSFDKADIVSNAAQNASIGGIRNSWALLNQEIEQKGLKGLDKFTTQVRGGAAAIISRVSGIVGAFGQVGMIIAAAGAAYTAFDSLASKAVKEQEDFNNSVSQTGSNVETLTKTIEEYTRRRKDGFSSEGVIALSNAIAGVTQGLEDQIIAFQRLGAASNAWDRLKDSIAGVFGKSNLDALKKSTASVVDTLTKGLQFSSMGPAAKNQLAAMLKIPPEALEDTKRLRAAIEDLDETTLLKLSDQIKGLSKELSAGVQAVQAFKESLQAIGKSGDQIIQSIQFSDLQGKLGVDLVNAAEKLASVLERDVLAAFTAIADLTRDPKALSAAGFSPEQIQNLFKAAQIQERINETQQELLKSEKELADYRRVQVAPADTAAIEFGISSQEQQAFVDFIQQDLQDTVDKASAALRNLKKSAEDFALANANIVDQLAEAGFKRLEISLKGAVQKARLSVEEFKIGLAAEAGLNTAQDELKIAKARANIEIAQAQAAFDYQKVVNQNTDAIVALTATMTADSLERQRERESKKSGFTQADDARFARLIQAQREIATRAEIRTQIRQGQVPQGGLIQDRSAPGRMIDVVPQLRREVDRQTRQAEMQLSAATASARAGVDIAQLKAQNQERKFANDLANQNNDLAKQRQDLAQQQLQLFVGINQQNTIQENLAAKLAEQAIAQAEATSKLQVIEQKRSNILQQTYGQESKQQVLDLLTQEQRLVEETRFLKVLQAEINELTKNQAATTEQIRKAQADRNVLLEQAQRLSDNTRKIVRDELDSRLALGDLSQTFLANLRTQRELEDQQIAYQRERRALLDEEELRQKALNDAKERQRKIEEEITKARTVIDPIGGLPMLAPATEPQVAAQTGAQQAVDNAQRQLDLQKGALDVAKQINDQTVQSITNQGRLNEQLAITKDLVSTIKTLGETFSGTFGTLGDKLANAANTIAGAFQAAQAGSVATEAQLKSIDSRIAAIGSNIDSLPDPEGEDKGAYEKLMKERKTLDRDREKSIVRQRDLEVAAAAKSIGATKSLFKEKTAAYKILDKTEKALHLFRMASLAAQTAAEIKAAFTSVTSSGTKIGAKTAEAGVDGVAGIIKAFASLPFPASLVAGAAMTAIMATLLSSIGGKNPPQPGGFTAKEQQAVQGTGQQYVNGKLVNRAGGVLGDPTEKADSIVTAIDMLSKEFYGQLGSGSSRIVIALEAIKKNTEAAAKSLYGKVSGFGMDGSAFGTVENTQNKLWGLWGRASTTITDAGVTISGTLDNLGKSLGNFQQYENVVRKSSSLFGLISSKSYSTNVKEIEKAAKDAFVAIFNNMQSVLIESAKALEGPSSTLVDAIKAIPIDLKVSVKDMTGKEAVDAILAELSVQLNAGAQKVFPYLVQYQKIGEELYETVARIVKDSEVLAGGLELLGQSITGFTDTASRIEFEQNLLELLGGAEKAASKFESYFENFLTPQEKFRVKFLQLTKTFTEANRTLPQTKEEFVKLFNSLDYVNSAEDRATFALLLNNTDRFNDLLELQSEITKKNTEDFLELKKSLSQFRASLLIGSTSVLSPTERYALARAEFEATRTKALEGKDPEALKKLQESSQTFLGLSRELYASGSQYVSDFNSVLKVLDDAGKLDITQVNYAAEQLKVTNDSLGVLQNIERILTLEATKQTTPTTPPRSEATDVMDPEDWREVTSLGGGGKLLFSESTGRYRIDPNAMGGFAHGLSLVGEEGPELVDFKTPGRVYTAEQTQGMFTPRIGSNAFQELSNKLQGVQEELVQLRKEQQKQTGDLIVTNYDAQQKVADEIVEAVMKSVQEKSWQMKNTPTIN